MNTKFIKYLKHLIGAGIMGIFILITFSTASFEATHSQIGEIELTYKNFTFGSDDICTSDNNWCNRVDLPNKSIVYGSIETEINAPEGSKDVDVWIHISCNGLGEGFYGQPNSFAVISVDNESKPEIIKVSDKHYQEFYYKYGQCQSFLNSFNVLGNKITLKIEMMRDARLDLEKVVLKFYDDGNESEAVIENKTIENESSENESITGLINDSLNYPVDSDNDGIPDIDDNCPEIKGPVCNSGCPTETDVDVDGLQEDNPDCQNYDQYPYDQDNDGIPTVKDCDDNAPKNTKIKGDDDRDGVSNCIDKCPEEKGDDKYGCPNIKEKETVKPVTSEQIKWGIAIFAAMIIIILMLLTIFLIRK